AALALATRKDAAAFDALVRLLAAAPDANGQRRVIQALVTLGDSRAPDAFLDRLENDPSGSAQANDLIKATGDFRRVEVADRLLALFEREKTRRGPAFGALLVVSGYDQEIKDPEDEGADRRWEEKQFPRRDALLARLLDRGTALGETSLLMRLLPGARWARGKEVDPPLALLANHPDETLRRAAVEALGWRLRKRGGDAEPLRRALG